MQPQTGPFRRCRGGVLAACLRFMFGKTSFALVVVVTVIIIITIKTTKDNVGTVAKSAEGMRSTECPPVANISQMRRARGGGGGSVFLPTSGRTSDVGGMFSATSIRKTVIDSSVVMPIDTFSPGRHVNDDAHRHPLTWSPRQRRRHRHLLT